MGGTLKKDLGLFDATMIIVGSMVGTGIFTTTGLVAMELPNAWHILLAWIVGGALTLLGALTYSELGAAFPHAGGDYVYLRESYGPWAGFLLGWIAFLIIGPGSIATLSLGLSNYALPLFHIEHHHFYLKKLIAVLLIAMFSTVNYFGIRYASKLQNTCSVLILLILMGMLIVGFIWGLGSLDNFKYTFKDNFSYTQFSVAIVSVIFAYSGWFASAYVGSEIRNPEKNIPRSIIGGTIIVTTMYMFVNVLYLYALPVTHMKGQVHIARIAYEALFGLNAALIVTLAIIIAILGSLNSAILTFPRIYYAMAEDGLFFKKVAKIHRRYHTPYVSIVFQAATSSILVILGNFYQLLIYTTFAMLITSVACALGVFILRIKRLDIKRPYRVPGYPYSTSIFLFSYLWIGLNIFYKKPYESTAGIIIALSGIPLYFLWKKKM